MRVPPRCLVSILMSLALAGCLSDADTSHNRSVLPTMTSPNHRDREDAEGGKSRLCEDTVVAGESKTVCY